MMRSPGESIRGGGSCKCCMRRFFGEAGGTMKHSISSSSMKVRQDGAESSKENPSEPEKKVKDYS